MAGTVKAGRRHFITHGSAAAAVALAGFRVPAFAQVGAGIALPLDLPGFCVDLGPIPRTPGLDSQSGKIWPYSGWTYCASADAIILFGGGHAASPDDGVNRLPIATLAWQRDYPMLPLAKMQQVNLNADGTRAVNSDGSAQLTYMTYPAKLWDRAAAGAPPPAFSPIARHTFTQIIASSVTGTVFVLDGNNGSPYGLPQGNGGNAVEYDPATKTWTDLGFPGATVHYAAAEDPVSGNIVLLYSGGMLIFDPRRKRFLDGLSKNTFPALGYTQSLVYFPPTDTFYYFLQRETATPYGSPVFPFKLDRKYWMPIWTGTQRKGTQRMPSPLQTNWHPQANVNGGGTRFVYDGKNELIVGGMVGGRMYALRPEGNNSGTWLQQSVTPTGDIASYCLEYVPSINTHILGDNVQQHTWAFRWDPARATEVPDTRLPKATISVGSKRYDTLRSACEVGGDIVLGAGGLYADDASAQIVRPVRIIGDASKTVLSSVGMLDKGILIADADMTIANLDISGAAGASGNDAAIRHNSGNLNILSCRIHDCQDGVLSANGVRDWPMTVVLDDCDVYACGTGDGQTHGLYVGRVTQFTLSNSRFWAQKIGHHVKSRAVKSDISNCELGTDLTGTESYNIDLPYGGAATITACRLRQGPHSDNPVMVNYGSEGSPHAVNNLAISGCRFESTTANAIGVRNAIDSAVTVLQDCDFIGQYRALLMSKYYVMRNCRHDGVALPDASVTP
jgi:hypothetical protein